MDVEDRNEIIREYRKSCYKVKSTPDLWELYFENQQLDRDYCLLKRRFSIPNYSDDFTTSEFLDFMENQLFKNEKDVNEQFWSFYFWCKDRMEDEDFDLEKGLVFFSRLCCHLEPCKLFRFILFLSLEIRERYFNFREDNWNYFNEIDNEKIIHYSNFYQKSIFIKEKWIYLLQEIGTVSNIQGFIAIIRFACCNYQMFKILNPFEWIKTLIDFYFSKTFENESNQISKIFITELNKLYKKSVVQDGKQRKLTENIQLHQLFCIFFSFMKQSLQSNNNQKTSKYHSKLLKICDEILNKNF